MFFKRIKIYSCLLTILFAANTGFSQNQPQEADDQIILELGVDLLERYFAGDTTWHVVHPETGESVIGMINFIEKKPLDSVLHTINRSLQDSSRMFVYRLPEDVADSLSVPGYYPHTSLQKDIESIRQKHEATFLRGEITVPIHLVAGIEEKAGVIPPGEGSKLFDKKIYELPDSLKAWDVIPDSLLQSPSDFRRFQRIDSMRFVYAEEMRVHYNDSVINACRDSIVENYRQQMFLQRFDFDRSTLTDSVNYNNYMVLKQYNDSVMGAVNDSIYQIIGKLSEYADFIDTTRIHMTNLVGDESSLLLQNGNQYFSRIWLKNEQNDSLRLTIKNLDKRTIQMLIDDGVTISRFRTKETKDFDFSTLSGTVSGLTGVSEKYKVFTPWLFGGDGTVGFSQTYLENWKKGGQSALSLLMILKGSANYSSIDNKVKWENSGEIRNGWIRPGGSEAELQKNDDKFEITSRFGLSAFKKWYYSTEFNYETQFFNGYKYPKSSNPDPISAFKSPSRTFFKVGLDYKPNKNFSLFLSPITLKNVYVRDTVKIDQTKFGISAGQKGFWEPGLNADLHWKKSISSDISYETKYKMFINYKKPWGNLDINWENIVIMQLNDYINLRMMVHMIYDEDVMFPIYDANDEKIGEKPRLQLKEFINIGFTYKINRQVTRTRRND
ncbi:MAG: DUF3078 domain-containing protein [Prolixibacteraceae bacterium]|nr:DUF3078 domain-containing protein [Prolixibacteraceae bacterium]